MNWLTDLVFAQSVAQTIVVLSMVAVAGLCLGHLKFRGLGLGVAGVLFAGLAFGHFGIHLHHETMDFAREFGLILFVYTIGMQVGPGFFSSLKKQGLPLNIMAAAIIFLGAGITLAFHYWADIPIAAAVGILSGATTNTPSLGAAQQALQTLPHLAPETSLLPGLGYAVAYPFGILGIILSMILIRTWFRVKISEEENDFHRLQAETNPVVTAVNLCVTNPNLVGLRLGAIPGLEHSAIVISRLEQEGRTMVAHDDIILQLGNTLTVVGPQKEVEDLRLVVGGESHLDLRSLSGALEVRRIMLTHKKLFGRSIADLKAEENFGVRFTRINRAEVELPNPEHIRLQAGDVLTVVGEGPSLAKISDFLGNSVKDLNQPQVVSVFIGIVLGVILGSIPFTVPGIPAPLRLGLAGGPLVVAILLSHLGRIGPFVWHMPQNANILLREIGIVLFLACVGLKAGGNFVQTLLNGDGLQWMLCGTVITLVPLLIVASLARKLFRQNYLSISGLMAGSMTDPPALAFANASTSTEGPAVSYATVYPLTMLLRVVCAQMLILFFG